MNKKPMIIIGIVIVLCLIGAGIFALTASSAERRLTEQLELGQKYLEEMNYEQAIVAFEAAIAIDPKCEEAYLALAETYVAQGTGESGVYLPGEDIYVAAESVEKAMEVLEEGYSQTGSETILTRLEELRDCYHAWEEGGVSSAGNEPGAGGQDADGNQASSSSQSGSNQTPSSDAGNQGQSAMDENDPLVQFLNAPFTDENGFGDVTSLDAAVAYAGENGLSADSEEAWEVWTSMGDLYLSYGGNEYFYPDIEEFVAESWLRVDTDLSKENSSYTQYRYSRDEAHPFYSISTSLADVNTMTGESVPPVGGFAGFLAEHECLTVEAIVETIGLDNEDIMSAVRANEKLYETQVETPYGTADIYIYNYTAFTVEAVNRSMSISFQEDSGAPWKYITFSEGVVRSMYDNGLTYYLDVSADFGDMMEVE